MRRRLQVWVRSFVRRWLWAEPPDDVVVGVGRCVPGVLVRIAAALAAAALLATFAFPVVGWSVRVGVGFAVGAALLVAWSPGMVSLPIGLVGLGVLVDGVPPVGLLLLLVLLVHLTVVAAVLAARVRFDTLVEWRVIGRLGREFAVVQVGAQVLALGAAALAGADLRAGDGVRAAALLTTLVVLVVVLPRFERVEVRRRD
jgi:hypothetical protein